MAQEETTRQTESDPQQMPQEAETKQAAETPPVSAQPSSEDDAASNPIPDTEGAEEASKPEEASSDPGADSDKEEPDLLLCEYTFYYNEEEAKRYVRATMWPALLKRDIVFGAIVCAFGIYFAVRGGWLLMLLMIAFAALLTGTPYIRYWIRKMRYLKQRKRLWNREVQIRLFEMHGEMEAQALDANNPPPEEYLQTYQFLYDDVYKVVEYENRIYLLIDPIHLVAASTNALPSEICNAMRAIAK